MKKGITIALLVFGLMACKKETAKTEITNATHQENVLPAEKPLEISEFPNELDPSVGSFVAIFKRDSTNNAILNFNIDKSAGKIVLNGNSLTLKKITENSETNELEFSGDSLTVSATGFVPQENEGGDCGYGLYKNLTIQYKNQRLELQNVAAQFCAKFE